MKNDVEKGEMIKFDFMLDDVDIDDYDVLVLLGGVVNFDVM